MIYCVRFADVVATLLDLGFREVAHTDATVIFARDDGERVLVHAPNADGNVPESLVNDAFDVGGLSPPPWDVFWCH